MLLKPAIPTVKSILRRTISCEGSPATHEFRCNYIELEEGRVYIQDLLYAVICGRTRLFVAQSWKENSVNITQFLITTHATSYAKPTLTNSTTYVFFFQRSTSEWFVTRV